MKSVAALKLKTMRTFYSLMSGTRMQLVSNEEFDLLVKEAINPLVSLNCETTSSDNVKTPVLTNIDTKWT